MDGSLEILTSDLFLILTGIVCSQPILLWDIKVWNVYVTGCYDTGMSGQCSCSTKFKRKGRPSRTGTTKRSVTRSAYNINYRRHTVLLLSTVREGKSIRGAFTGAMADQFSCTDGKTDICEMFYKAAHKVTQDHRCKQINQTSVIIQTTVKKLVLPGVATTAAV